jgi:hypothetical protein
MENGTPVMALMEDTPKDSHSLDIIPCKWVVVLLLMTDVRFMQVFI